MLGDSCWFVKVGNSEFKHIKRDNLIFFPRILITVVVALNRVVELLLAIGLL